MNPEISTLFLVVIVISFVFSGALAAVGFRRSPELMLWSAALFLHGVGYSFFGLRGRIPDFISIVLANTAASAIYALLAEGFFRFLKRPPPRLLLWGPVLLTFVTFSLLLDDFKARLILASFLFGAQALFVVYVLFAHRQHIAGRGKYIFAGSALLNGVTLLTRGVFVVTGVLDNPTFATLTPWNTFNLLIGMTATSLLAIGLLMMILERDERVIAESESRMRALFESSNDAIMVLDHDRFIDCNAATLKLFGIASKAAFAQLSFIDLAPTQQPCGTDSVLLARQMTQKALRESSYRFDFEHKRLDSDQTFPAEVLLNTFAMEGRTVLQAVIRDITERKAQQLELERRVAARTEELATARAEAEAASAVKTRFMANVSHEMRTPMNGILGFAELGRLKVGKVNDAQMVDYFERILQSGKRLNHLTESLLSLAQDAWSEQAGIASSALQTLEPAALVMQCISMFDKVAATQQQNIVLENNASITTIEGDRSRLRQVLEHLLGNALRYSPGQTTVTVRLQDVSAPGHEGKRLSIQVIDQGCGIPEKELDAIFEPFYESTRTATGAGGTGLGLALCKSIVLRHKGRISASNQPTGGAMFEIILPVR